MGQVPPAVAGGQRRLSRSAHCLPVDVSDRTVVPWGGMDTDIPTTEEEWRRRLTPEQYDVLRRKGTERAFTGQYWNVHDDGVYRCVACGSELFDAETKFESGTGWPSFTEPVNLANVELHTDTSYGMRRTEVTCKRCGGHLGHVFDDGPGPTGQRYCMNSIALDLEPQATAP
jgi:peptide-methionine (R)-S-oxide reductase